MHYFGRYDNVNNDNQELKPKSIQCQLSPSAASFSCSVNSASNSSISSPSIELSDPKQNKTLRKNHGGQGKYSKAAIQSIIDNFAT